MKIKLVILAVAILAMILFIKAAGSSVISFEVTGSPSGTAITYSAINQTTGKISKTDNNVSGASLNVPKGDYEVRINSGDYSYSEVVSTKGFFAKTHVKAALKPENLRRFVGNNPGLCMHLVAGVLVSYSCAGNFQNTNIHYPATITQPTYVSTANTSITGILEGIIDTPEGTLALVQTQIPTDSVVGSGTGQVIYHLGGNLTTDVGTPLPDLDKNTTYGIAAFGNGFTVHDLTNENFYTYSSTKSRAVKLAISKPSNQDLFPTSYGTDGRAIVVAYTSDSDPAGKVPGSGNSSEVYLYANGKVSKFVFQEQATAAKPCGDNRLCLLGVRGLEVYDITTGSPKLIYTMSGVTSIERSALPNTVLAIRPGGVSTIDTSRNISYTSYSFGDYTFCGFEPAVNGYLLCVADANQNKSALYINQTEANTDSIDKKLLEVEKATDLISSLTIYGNIIFIVPHGQNIYDPATRSYGPDPVVQKTVTAAINKKIDEQQIDRRVYKITITAPID